MTITEHQILELIAAYTGTEREALHGHLRLQEDLGLDSIDAIEILVEVEGSTGDRFTTEDLVELATVQDIIDRLGRT